MLCCDTARGTHSRRLAHIRDAQIISMTDVISFLSGHFYYYSCVADEAGYLASVFIVSISGMQKITSYMSTRIHISLWHQETAAERRRKGKRTVWISFLCSIYASINVKPAGKGGAWDWDLTFFKNFSSNALPTGKSFQSNAQKYPHPWLHIRQKKKQSRSKNTPSK